MPERTLSVGSKLDLHVLLRAFVFDNVPSTSPCSHAFVRVCTCLVPCIISKTCIIFLFFIFLFFFRFELRPTDRKAVTASVDWRSLVPEEKLCEDLNATLVSEYLLDARTASTMYKVG